MLYHMTQLSLIIYNKFTEKKSKCYHAISALTAYINVYL